MKNLKRILSVALVLVMLLTAAPLSGFVGLELPAIDWGIKASAKSVAASGSCGENVTYTYDSETKEVVISGTGPMASHHGNYYNSPSPFCQSDIKTVIIEDGVTTIGQYMFYDCDSLVSISIPNSVISIESYALYDCDALTSLVIPDSVETIGRTAIYSCDNLFELSVGKNLKSIDMEVFSYCLNLKTVTWYPESISYDSYCFSYNNNIETLNIGSANAFVPSGFKLRTVKTINFINGTESIPDSSFSGMTGLQTVTIPDSVTYIGSKAFYGCTSLTTVTIPSSVKTIETSAFENCTELEFVYLNEGLERIEDKAFYNCSYLTDINIPKSVTYIGETILGKTAWHNYRGKGVIIFDGWVFGYKGTPAPNTALTFDKNIRGVADDAFKGETNLVSVEVSTDNPFLSSAEGVLYDKNKTTVIVYPNGRGGAYIMPDSVVTIDDCTFYNCKKLTSISLSDNLIDVGDYAFYNCDGFKSFTFTDKVKTIGAYSFYDCDYIKEIIIPDSVETIGSYAFYNTTTDPTTGADFFISILEKVVIGDGVKTIGLFAFYDCRNLTSLTLGESVETIGNYAFYQCNILKLDLPVNLKLIGDKAFYNNEFTVVVLPDSIEIIGVGAFDYCRYLTDVTIGTGIKSIGASAFFDCLSLESVYCGVTQRQWNQIEGYNNIPSNVDLFLNHPHDYTYTVVTKPTCTATGVGRYYCTFGDSYDVTIPATGHSLQLDENNSVPADCTNSGYNSYLCTVCGYTEKKTVSMGGHVWSQSSYTAPTCDVDGARVKTCTVCGDTTTETVPANGHIELSIAKVNPTCTEDGNELGTKCYICGEILEGCEVIPATGHTSYNVTAVAPTCTKSGLTAGTKCSVCKVTLSGIEYVPANGHTNKELDAIEPTCTEKGKTAGTQCTVCNVITSGYKDVPANGHTRVDVAGKDATCLYDGYTTSAYCDVCDVTLKEQKTIAALGHNKYVYIKAEDATCTKDGCTEELRCTRCDILLSDKVSETIPALGHDVITVESIAETCTATGLTEGKECSRCDYVEVAQEVTPALGHAWGETTTVESTCVTNGYTSKTCQRCKAVEKTTLELIDHDSETVILVVEATCTEKGFTEGRACSMCDKIMIAPEEVDALKHDMVLDAYQSPTCTADGYEYYLCKRSGCNHDDKLPLEKLKHNYEGEWIVDVVETCTTDGSAHRKCTECDEIEKNIIPAYGHKEEYVHAKAETCLTDGISEGAYCLNCDEIIYGCEVIPATGHSMTGWYVSIEPTCTLKGEKKNDCNICGYSESEVMLENGHYYSGEWTIITNASCTSDGVKIKLCNSCLKVIAEVIPRTGHTDINNDNSCDSCSVNLGQTQTGHIHNWGSWLTLKDPTCTTDGGMYRICTICGDDENAYISAKGHSEKIAEAVLPTCESNGRSEYIYCDVCDVELSEYEVYEALGHDVIWSVVKTATCTENGVNSAECSRCDFGYTVEIPALSHADNNGDDICDICHKINLSGKPQDTTIICTCNCHKTGIRKLLFKLVLFFQKFLKLNKTCACGIVHY